MIDSNINPYDLKNLDIYHPNIRQNINSMYYDDFDLILRHVDGSTLGFDVTSVRLRTICKNDKMTDEEFVREFAYRLKRKIRFSGMTGAEFARLTGISQPTISNYCTGKRAPTIHSTFKILNALNCNFNDLQFIPRH